MSLSSNSLFHFTNSKTKLFQILSEGIAPSYCWEQLVIRGRYLQQGVPLASFCDIPLSQVKDQLTKYGSYGIAFSLDWGVKNGLNPVFYVDNKSLVSKKTISIGDHVINTFSKEVAKKKPSEIQLLMTEEIVFSYITLICNMKNYQGELRRKGKLIKKDYKFYDEREWRYIPENPEIKPVLTEKEFKQIRGNSTEKPILKEAALKFSLSDIKYILVKDDSEIHKLLEHIYKLKLTGESHKDIEILGTKIITAKQIREDF